MSERNTIHDIKKRHEQEQADMDAQAKAGKIVLPPWTAHVDRGTLLTKVEELEAEREWQPIKTYDMLQVKPKFAVFFVQAIEPKRAYGYRLGETTTSTRVYGNRAISHWMPLPAPPEEAENE